MTRIWIGLLFVVAALVTGIATQAAFDAEKQSAPPRRERPNGGRFQGPPAPLAISGADIEGTYQLTATIEAVRAEQERQERERIAAEEAAARAVEESRLAATRPATNPPPLRTGISGPHSDAWWWGVAICEQGGRDDPYYGYFSWMDGSAAGMTWEEQVAKSNDLLIRAGREIGPWAASCVAAGYRASPGG